MAQFSTQRAVIGFIFIWLAALTWPAYAQELATLTAAGGAANHRFGFAVAISGDTVVVGAPYADSGRGEAYVFVKPAGGWSTTETPTATLTDSSVTGNSQFGFAVAISGNTIVIGAPGTKVGNRNNQGQASVFVKPGTGSARGHAGLSDRGGASRRQIHLSLMEKGRVGLP